MGGLMSSPKPPAPPAVPDPSIEVEKLAIEEREARLDDIKRRRRGRAGTVNTAWVGAQLAGNSDAGIGKKLLGE